jgi:hypothetical protein
MGDGAAGEALLKPNSEARFARNDEGASFDATEAGTAPGATTAGARPGCMRLASSCTIRFCSSTIMAWSWASCACSDSWAASPWIAASGWGRAAGGYAIAGW